MKASDKTQGMTQASLKALLHYDPVTGVFTRLTSPVNGVSIGDSAGFIHSATGYHKLKVSGRCYYAARLAWLYMTGEWPNGDVDHKNMNKADTRWENLRSASRIQNGANRGATKRSSTGLKGVFSSRRKKNPYVAMIRVAGLLHHIGVFPTAAQAHAAYLERAKSFHGEFARAA